jgi:hypothetical protein
LKQNKLLARAWNKLSGLLDSNVARLNVVGAMKISSEQTQRGEKSARE